MHAGPLVAEGVLILDALGAIGRKPDFFVYVVGEGGHGLSSRIAEYRMRHKPEQQAQKLTCVMQRRANGPAHIKRRSVISSIMPARSTTSGRKHCAGATLPNCLTE